MKLKYILGVVLSAFLLMGCSDDNEVGSLGNITLDQTYLTIPEAGGSVTLTVNATESWEFDKVFKVTNNGETTQEPLPTWLTATKVSGEAGTTQITFTAPATTSGREAELKIKVGGNSQFILVRQGSLGASTATCADIMNGTEGKNYRVTGTVTKISGYEYGNWFLDDGTYNFAASAKNQDGLYIYGTLDKNGKAGKVNPITGADGWQFEQGDVVTVEGPLSIYNGQYELVNVTVVKIVKSLIKVMDSPATLGKEGGDFQVKLAYKGSGAYASIPEECQSWIHNISTEYKAGVATLFESNPADTAIITFHVDANELGARTGSINFTSSNSQGSSTVSCEVSQDGAIVAATVEQFLAAAVGKTQYRITGMVSELYYNTYNVLSGFYITDYTGTTLVYKPAGFTGAEAHVGDVVTVCGERGEYKTTAQMVNGTLENVNYAVQAISVADFRNLPDDNTKYYILSGTITEATEANTKNDVTQYGNFNITDATGTVYVYGVLPGWGSAKGQFGKLNLTWGDNITIIAHHSTYKGMVQAAGAVFLSKDAPAN